MSLIIYNIVYARKRSIIAKLNKLSQNLVTCYKLYKLVVIKQLQQQQQITTIFPKKKRKQHLHNTKDK